MAAPSRVAGDLTHPAATGDHAAPEAIDGGPRTTAHPCDVQLLRRRGEAAYRTGGGEVLQTADAADVRPERVAERLSDGPVTRRIS